MKVKKSILLIILILSITTQAQKIEVRTLNVFNFKRHFTYSIESGLVDNQVKQYIAGNKTDYVNFASNTEANSVFNNTVSNKGQTNFLSQSEKILLTDFVVQPGNFETAAGTGIYFPNGPTGMGYPFFALYDRRTMTV